MADNPKKPKNFYTKSDMAQNIKKFGTRVKQEVPLGPGNIGKVGKAAKEVVESFSKRGTELVRKENAAINAQSKAAESYKTKDLGKSESAKKAAQTRKYNQEAKEEYAYSKGKQSGLKKGVAAGAAAGAAAEYIVSKGTQKDHKVTNVDRKTGKSK